MKTIYKKTSTGFAPACKEAQEWYDKTNLGQLVELTGNRTRNLSHHRKFFALLGMVVNNSDEYDTVDQFRFILMATLQRGKWIEVKNASRPMFIPDSINFKSMSQAEFDVLYNDSINAILKFFIPIGREDLERELATA